MLSDADLALILEGKAKKLKDGHMPREEVTRELAELVAEDLIDRDEDLVTRGRLQSQGRASFGRSKEGVDGLALFLPEE
jgi:hypothetical protein